MIKANYAPTTVINKFDISNAATMLNYLTSTTVIEILCFLIAMVCWSNGDKKIWKYCALFLFLTCLAELTGIYLKRNGQPQNAWIYNILMLFEAAFINKMFAELLHRHKKTRIVIITGFMLFAMLYVYDLFNHGIGVYNNFAYTTMSVISVLYALYYYYDLINNEEYILIRYSAEFWWVTGVLFYYFGETACNLFYDKLHAVYISYNRSLTYYIYNTLNLILYTCWSYSFICRKWLTKRSEIL